MNVHKLIVTIALCLALTAPKEAQSFNNREQRAALAAFCIAAVPSYWGAIKNKALRGTILGMALGYVAAEVFFPHTRTEVLLSAPVLGALTGNFLAS